MIWEPTVDEVEGRFAAASNLTILGRAGGVEVIYKPTSGARPLWDFDVTTLAHREVLTYRISEALGLGIVPETVLGSGPYGPGSIQRAVSFDEVPINLIETNDDALWPVALLDVVVDNADRKVGHILSTDTGLVAIDHGLTLHPEPHLRTVLWGFAGQPVPDGLVAGLPDLMRALEGGLGDDIEGALGLASLTATVDRVGRLLEDPVHPHPPRDRPAIPWPPV